MSKLRALIISLLAITILSSCGSSNSDDDTSLSPPQLAAIATQTLTVDVATNIQLINNGGGELSSCTANPTLPSALEINVNNDSCQIIGAPETEQDATPYVISAINNAGTSTITISIVITKPVIAITQIELSGDNTISVGGTITLSATITPNNATNQNLDWSSSDEAVATVTDGVVTALSAGSATITATATDGSGVSGEFVISVSAADIAITQIALSGNNTIIVGGTITLSATITPNNATNQNLDWSSSDEAVATVTDGVVTALSAGSATITATATDGSGVSGEFVISVSAADIAITQIELSGDNTISVGGTITLSATITPNNATNQNLDWSSSDEAVATVTDGVVTALSAGTATITATATDGSGVSGEFVISVSADDIAITQIALSGNNTIIVGSTTTLSVTITPSDATNQEIDWSSSDEAVATVTDGVVTALSAGTATITATATDGSGVSGEFVITTGAPTITEFTTTFFINAINIGDTIGTVTITNSPTTVTILESPNGYDQHFSINANGRLTVANQLTATIYILQIEASNGYGSTLGTLTITANEVRQIAKLVANDGVASDDFGVAVAIDNNYIVIGAADDFEVNDDDGDRAGAYLFTINTQTGEVTQTAKLIANDVGPEDNFGSSVAIYENHILVANNYKDGTKTGSVYLFTINTQTGEVTQTAKLIASNNQGESNFGGSLAVNSGYAVIGAPGYDVSTDANQGSVYMFDLTLIGANALTPVTETFSILAVDYARGDRFGTSVAIDGDYIFVGAPKDNFKPDPSGNSIVDIGSVYIFKLDKDLKSATQTYQFAPNTAEGIQFGQSIAIDNDRLLIGTNSSPEAYLFTFDKETGEATQTAELKASDSSSEAFGYSVALYKDYAIVGSYNDSSVYLFDLNNVATTAAETIKIVADDVQGNDFFGHSIAAKDGYLVVGSFKDDDNGSSSGSSYVFNFITNED